MSIDCMIDEILSTGGSLEVFLGSERGQAEIDAEDA